MDDLCPAAAALWRIAPLRWLGAISFSLYLWHLPITTSLAPWLRDTVGLGVAPSAAVIVAAVLLASTVSYYCVERPFLNGGSQVVAWLANLQKRSLRVG